MSPTFHRVVRRWSPSLVVLLAACGGGGGGGGGPAPAADLAVTLAAPASTLPGATITWTMVVSNLGAVHAATVLPSLDLPAGLTAVTASAGGILAGTRVNWPAIAALAPNATVTLTVSAIAPAIGPLTGDASVTTVTPESDATNNTLSQRTVLGFTPLATLRGEAANDNYGWVADALPDLNGDGRPEFLVGAPMNSAGGAGAGRVYVYSGATAAALFTFTGPAAGAQLGTAVADAGDIDGDGTSDILSGGPGGAGVALVHSGANGNLLRTLPGPAAGSRFGDAVAGIGDVDGDGRGDLLVGATASGANGQAFVISGATGATLRTHTGTTGANFGYGVGALGDVSGDGVPDYAIGGGQGNGGHVEAFSGATGARLYLINSDASGTLFGQYWIDRVGDTDGDGRPDFYAADYPNGALGPGTGRGYLISGANGAVLRTFTGEARDDNFGMSRNSGHDVDGDGVADLFIAAYHNDEGGANAGKAYVYSGASGALLRTMTSVQAGQTLGFDAVQLGDVDGDGLIDFLLTGDQENGQAGTAIVVRGTPLP